MTAEADAMPPPSGPPLLLTGMSRSGTTWLCRVLNTHPEAVAFGESLFWGRWFIEPTTDAGYDAAQRAKLVEKFVTNEYVPAPGKPGGLRCLDNPAFFERLRNVFDDVPDDAPLPADEAFMRLCRAFADAEGKACWIEKTPHHCMWLSRIYKHLPDARVVVTYRDPYTFMLSYKHQGDRKPEPARSAFRKRYHPAAAAIVWRGYARTIERLQKENDPRIHLVEFDRYRADPDGVLHDVQAFFGLTPHDLSGNVPPDNSSFQDRPRPQLSAADRFWINRLASREIAALGFRKQPTGWDVVALAGSFLSTPLWMGRNLLDLKKRVDGSLTRYLLRWVRGSG